MNPVILQNHAIYLTNLHKRKDDWLKCRDTSYNLARAASQFLEHFPKKISDTIVFKAALDILETEILRLDTKHKVKKWLK